MDNAEVAAARGTSRYMDIVRIRRRSIAPLCEDPVTLAVNAARPLVEAAGPDAFELLIVATESGFDYGKPLSSYVHRHLGLTSRCRNLEVKHACYGGTASLQLACAWIRSEAAPGKKALVVTTDLPGNQFGQPAELTPGTGAVALSVSAEPRVLALDLASGYAAREVYDTARPTATGHWVDEVLSLGAYLDLLELAYGHYRSQRGEVPLEEDFDYLVYHMPLETLVRKAHEVLLEESGAEAGRNGGAGVSFDRMVAPSLRYCGETGNIFSGTLYAGLAALIDSDPPPHPGARVGLYSYGSGSCAEFFAGHSAGDGAGGGGRAPHRRAPHGPAPSLVSRVRDDRPRRRVEGPLPRLHAGAGDARRPLRGGVSRERPPRPRERQGLLPPLRAELTAVAPKLQRLTLPRALSWSEIDRLAEAVRGASPAGLVVLQGADGVFCEGGALDDPEEPQPRRFGALLAALGARPAAGGGAGGRSRAGRGRGAGRGGGRRPGHDARDVRPARDAPRPHPGHGFSRAGPPNRDPARAAPRAGRGAGLRRRGVPHRPRGRAERRPRGGAGPPRAGA